MRALFVTLSHASTLTVPLERVFLEDPTTPIHHLLHSHRRLESFNEQLLNNGNLAYTGPVWVGTPL